MPPTALFFFTGVGPASGRGDPAPVGGLADAALPPGVVLLGFWAVAMYAVRQLRPLPIYEKIAVTRGLKGDALELRALMLTTLVSARILCIPRLPQGPRLPRE